MKTYYLDALILEQRIAQEPDLIHRKLLEKTLEVNWKLIYANNQPQATSEVVSD